jgi:hypothetical protein
VEVRSPVGVGGNAVGNAGQPRQRPPGANEASCLDPRVENSGLIMGAGQVPLCCGGEQFSDWIGAGSGQEQQVAAQGRPALAPR